MSRTINPLIPLMLAFLIIIPACGSTGPSPNPPASDNPTFQWETTRLLPASRDESPVEWYNFEQYDEVLDISLDSQKPIFLYLSKYGDFASDDIEKLVLHPDGWGDEINDRFIPLEIHWYDDPALALQIATPAGLGLRGRRLNIPSISVLTVSMDEDDNPNLNIVDTWDSSNTLYFPGEYDPNIAVSQRPMSDPAVEELLHHPPSSDEGPGLLEDLLNRDGAPFRYPRAGNYVGGGLDGSISSVNMWREFVGDSPGFAPQLGLYYAFTGLAYRDMPNGLHDQVTLWATDSIGFTDSPLLEYMAFGMPPSDLMLGSGIPLAENIMAAEAAMAIGEAPPVPLEDLFGELYSLVTDDDGNYAGGFPPYFDTMSALMKDPFEDNDINPLELLLGGEEAMDSLLEVSPDPGPRDIPWVNARILTLWLRLLKIQPGETRTVELAPGLSTGEFIDAFTPVMIAELETAVGIDNPSDMRLMDKIYMLGLYNEYYQMTGDIALLEKAGTIAATFPADTPEDWSDATALPLYPELALNLYYYGWLAEDEDARATAKFIIEAASGYITMSMGSIEDVELVYANEIINSKCIHIAVIAPVGSDEANLLLETALAGWDPRKIAQVLDPERDADLIERKGYSAMEGAVVFVCVDDQCYMPISDPGELEELLAEVIEDLEEL